MKHLNADPDDYSVIFTSGATASLKLVAESFKFTVDDAFYYLTDSHTSVLGMRGVVDTKNIIPVTKEKLLDATFSLPTGGLITFPAQCNFNGFKFPLDSIGRFHANPAAFVCLDAASFLSSNFLDLRLHQPDFVCLSFYKIFGYPTGLGALIVSKRGEKKLEKKFYGGGTVKIALTRTNWHVKRDPLHERFEDGTIPFLSIIALQTCFHFMENLLGADFVHRVSRHVFNVGKYLHHQLGSLRHHNDRPVVTFYHETDFDDPSTQGGIVNFNLRHADGSFVGFAEFSCIAALHNIVLRTGCFCNPGACQTHLQLSTDELMQQFNAGHICGDDHDLIDGAPTGSIRASFGYYTTKGNVDELVRAVMECYVETSSGINDVKVGYRRNRAQPKLKSIRIYPIKSCAPMVSTGSWEITRKGLKYDREWMIVNGANGTSMTQKNDTRMCLISPVIDEHHQMMRLHFPGVSSIAIPLQNDKAESREARMCETKVCGDRTEGFDCGDEVARWLSDVLSTSDLRLIKQSADGRKNGSISLSNQAQFLLISEPSVKWLMNQVDEWDGLGNDVENVVNRFRGNFVVDDLEPLAENNFTKLRIGRTEFDVQGPCTRCQMICIDQNTGEKTTEPLRTIGKVFKGKMRFGIYLKHSNDQLVITCGDEIFT